MTRARRIPKPAAMAAAPRPDPDDVSDEEIVAIGAALADLGWALVFLQDVVNRMRSQRVAIDAIHREETRLHRECSRLDAQVRHLLSLGEGLSARKMRAHAQRWRAAAIAAGHPDPTNPYARKPR